MSIASHGYAPSRTRFPLSPALLRATVGIIAIGIVAFGLAAISYAILASGAISAPAPRNPFATGNGGYGTTGSGLSRLVIIGQAYFYAALTAAVQALKSEGTGLMSLTTVGFLYGVFHAAGPGHGKGVISGYIIASKGSMTKGLSLSVAAALLQAVVAIAVVGLFAIVLKSTAVTINAAARNIELASFAAVAGLGAVLLWAKAGEFVHLCASIRRGDALDDEATVQPLQSPSGARDWQIFAGVVLAAGIRPCSGAIILLVFSLSQGMFVAGVIGALAMALGTSITTGTLASLTVFAKSVVRKITIGRGNAGPLAFSLFELLAAAFVLVLGTMLFTAFWNGGLLSGLD